MKLFKSKTLTPNAFDITSCKATEAPGSGKYNQTSKHTGTYLCRNCGQGLFNAHDKFDSRTGWPSFDDSIKDHVDTRIEDDGTNRTEIICKQCHAHLGHLFKKEGFTAKQTRHCVNSGAIEYTSTPDVDQTEEAILALGCFWKPQKYYSEIKGVILTEVGYTGGKKNNPTYEEVCRKNTGHFEAIRIVFDPKIISYSQILDLFFQYHDASQKNGQGCDIGEQYKSAIFYINEDQKNIADAKIKQMAAKIEVATQLIAASIFWPAEEYHQNYLNKNL